MKAVSRRYEGCIKALLMQVGRRLKVLAMTADTGKNEWHYGELLAHRILKGSSSIKALLRLC